VGQRERESPKKIERERERENVLKRLKGCEREGESPKKIERERQKVLKRLLRE
jgi:hypothetical protein